MRRSAGPTNRTRLTAILAVALLTVGTAACGGPKTDNGAADNGTGPIAIGASIPLSGPLAGFGSFQKWGYERAVKEVNDAGGLDVGGTRRKVELSILDDKTDPNQTSANTEKLISSTGAVALLGSCTPSLVIPGALVAERSSVPLVTGCAPAGAFTSAKQWTWAWDLFFAEPDISKAPFETMNAAGSQTNKKVAILHDNGPDGKVVGGTLWPETAASYGYQVVANVEFPVDNTDFSAAVQQAKNAEADVVLVDAVTPQAVSIRKQMATAGYTPKVLVMEKGGEPVQFAQALGTLADGVLVGAYWDPSFPYPGAKELAAAYEKETGQGWSQHIADSYTAAKVLLDAISRAGTTDRAKVNEAIGKTDQQYPVGPVKFNPQHVAVLGIAEVQWRGGRTTVVWPADRATGTLLFPMPAS
jgi:branched-chain amino acid transport system substrate-binding protein